MAQFVNTFALSTQSISSRAIGPLGMVAHRVDTPGRYLGRVRHGDEEVARLDLTVVDEPGQAQADIDLSKLVPRPGAQQRNPARFKISREGYALFFVSTGAGGYGVSLEGPVKEGDDDKPRRVFDSRELGKGDLFVVTLLRPGQWIARAEGAPEEADITVSYPEPGKKSYRPADQATPIEAGARGMRPAALKIGPGAGVVFQIAYQPAAITVALSEPDDGKRVADAPGQKGKRRVRWTNPRPPKP